MGTLIDRTGLVYGRLTVLGRDVSTGPASNGVRTKWACQCSCGALVTITGHDLSRKDTTSCGCYRDEKIGALNRSHGQNRTPTYRSWQAAKDRCYNSNNHHFRHYGGRGIRMCSEWVASFEAFLADMGRRPTGQTLDRIDGNGDYTKGNCRWATPLQQANNRRDAILWAGRKLTIKAIANEVGVPRTSLNKLLKRGLQIDDAVAHAVSHRR